MVMRIALRRPLLMTVGVGGLHRLGGTDIINIIKHIAAKHQQREQRGEKVKSRVTKGAHGALQLVREYRRMSITLPPNRDARVQS